jgi:trans-aconitate methyltransferase
MDWDAFFEVHKGLPRQGPGNAEDVAWAVSLAQVPADGLVADAGCGPGDDTLALRAALPSARILAFDMYQGFVDEAQARVGDNPHTVVELGDMAKLPQHPLAPFDLIWCAGALYFLGLEPGLKVMKRALKPGGVLAFSEPAYFTQSPSQAGQAFWEGYPTRSDSGVAQAVSECGYTLLGQRAVTDAGWEAYYGPMEARIARLSPTADDAVRAACDAALAEAQAWRSVRDESGYTLVVARAA